MWTIFLFIHCFILISNFFSRLVFSTLHLDWSTNDCGRFRRIGCSRDAGVCHRWSSSSSSIIPVMGIWGWLIVLVTDLVLVIVLVLVMGMVWMLPSFLLPLLTQCWLVINSWWLMSDGAHSALMKVALKNCLLLDIGLCAFHVWCPPFHRRGNCADIVAKGLKRQQFSSQIWLYATYRTEEHSTHSLWVVTYWS